MHQPNTSSWWPNCSAESHHVCVRYFAQALDDYKHAAEQNHPTIADLEWVPMDVDNDEHVRAVDFSAGVLVGQNKMRFLYAQKVGAFSGIIYKQPAKPAC